MRHIIWTRLDLTRRRTDWKTELTAGLTSFFTVFYIAVVNSAILADAGIPHDAGVIATLAASFAGCLLMGLWADAPVVLVPGMGLNALFTYTVVQSMGLAWHEALAVVFVAGLLFAAVAFTRLSRLLADSVPASLKEAITAGIGLLLTFIGLQKGGIVAPSAKTFVTLGNLASPGVFVTVATLALTLVLYVRRVRGSFLIGIAFGTALAALLGQVAPVREAGSLHAPLARYASVAGALSFDRIGTFPFWTATLSLAMVLVFENMGLLYAMLERREQFPRAYQANAVSAALCGLLGTSPTVSAVESAAGIAAGGKTGLTALTAGALFALSFFCLPVLERVPDEAIAPVLLIVGGLMVRSVARIPFQDFSEGFPAFLILALIPLTYSIADGIAFGFIAYPLLKLALGRGKEVAVAVYLIAGLFLLNFVLHAAA